MTQKVHSDNQDFDWGYSKKNGPDRWNSHCPACQGKKQSPIDIVGAVLDPRLEELRFNYQVISPKVVMNGYTLQCDYPEGSQLHLGLEVYDFSQFHFHTSAEHLIDGKRHQMEAHLVHKQQTTEKLAVISVLFELGQEANPFLHKLGSRLPRSKGKERQLKQAINLMEIFPDNLAYYLYEGSLTTPPCSEIVTWIILKKSIPISKKQLKKFKKIMGNNCRPIQALNERSIRLFSKEKPQTR